MAPRKASPFVPKTPLSKRLHGLFGDVNFSEKSPEYGVTSKTLKGYICGDVEPTASFLIAVCRTFSVSPDWLLTGKKTSASAEEAGADGIGKTTLSGEQARIARDLAAIIATYQGVLQKVLDSEEEAQKVAALVDALRTGAQRLQA